MRSRLALAGVGAVMVLAELVGAWASVATAAPQGGGEGSRFEGRASRDSVVVGGAAQGASPRSPSEAGAPQAAYEYVRAPRGICGSADDPVFGPDCVGRDLVLEVVPTCGNGGEPLGPLFRRPLGTSPGAGSRGWEQVDQGGCPEDEGVVTLSVEEFRRLPLVASVPSIQPADGRNLVGMPLIVFTDPSPQELATTVVGVPVTVRATPTQFSWDFGDGSAPVVTADAGAPYPDHTVSHPYTQDGEYTVRLTTTWRGEFQVAATTTWRPVAGTATTVSAPFTVTAEEAVPRLVAEP